MNDSLPSMFTIIQHLKGKELSFFLLKTLMYEINQSISLLTSMRGMGLPRSSEPEAHV